MKNYLLILLTVVFLPLNSFAQDTVNVKHTNLVASKNGLKKMYPIGTKLLIRYLTDSLKNKVRGILINVSENAIFIKQSKKDEIIRVAFTDITLVKKINPTKRTVYGIIGTTLLIGGVSLIENGGNSPASAMRGAFLFPVIGVGVYILCTVPITLIIEKMNETKRSNGWTFQFF